MANGSRSGTERMAQKNSQKRKSNPAKPVVREASFVRLAADNIIVVDLGRDIEFALIAVGNPITKITRVETEESFGDKVETRIELAEIGRVRVSPFVALSTAMNVISKLIEGGQVDTDALKKTIQEMIESSPENSEVELVS